MRARSSSVEVGVLARHRLPHQVPQPRHRRVPLGHLLLRQRGLGAPQREGELVGERRPCARRHPDSARSAPRISAPERRCAPACAGSQPSSSSSPRLARTAATAAASCCALRHGVVHVVGREHRQAALGGERGEQRRCRRVSSGLPWSMSSTWTASRPNSAHEPVELAMPRASAPPSASARRTAPLRHPVSTAQCPSACAASSSRS